MLALDAIGHVLWWPVQRHLVPAVRIPVHMIGETNRHAGHADIVRELIDGAAGLRDGNDNLAPGDQGWWQNYRSRLEYVAQQAAKTEPSRRCPFLQADRPCGHGDVASMRPVILPLAVRSDADKIRSYLHAISAPAEPASFRRLPPWPRSAHWTSVDAVLVPGRVGCRRGWPSVRSPREVTPMSGPTTLLPFQPATMTGAQLAAASFLARYSGRTHSLYAYQLREWFACASPTGWTPCSGSRELMLSYTSAVSVTVA